MFGLSGLYQERTMGGNRHKAVVLVEQSQTTKNGPRAGRTSVLLGAPWPASCRQALHTELSAYLWPLMAIGVAG